MLELDQKVTVITEKGTFYDGFVLARASGEGGAAAYKIGLGARASTSRASGTRPATCLWKRRRRNRR
jgi:hypothetical protein